MFRSSIFLIFTGRASTHLLDEYLVAQIILQRHIRWNAIQVKLKSH